jgi:hypothetical protein
MDIFTEQLIKKNLGPKDYAIIAATILGGILLVILSMLIPAISFLVLIGVCFGAYYLITSRSLEYEYSITNGSITIDKIISKRKRKRVISVEAHDIEDMGKFRPETVKSKSAYKPVFASQYDDGRDAWYFCAHSAKNGNVLVVFDPNEKVLNSIKPFLPRQVSFVVFGRN